MRRQYSKHELETLLIIKQKYGRISYCKPAEIESEFFKETGIRRASGALYMASWRLDQGRYDHLLKGA
jgi:hypothetical protein